MAFCGNFGHHRFEIQILWCHSLLTMGKSKTDKDKKDKGKSDKGKSPKGKQRSPAASQKSVVDTSAATRAAASKSTSSKVALCTCCGKLSSEVAWFERSSGSNLPIGDGCKACREIHNEAFDKHIIKDIQ